MPALIVSQPSTGQVCGPAVFTVIEPTCDWSTSAVNSGDAFTSFQVSPGTPITTTFASKLPPTCLRSRSRHSSSG